MAAVIEPFASTNGYDRKQVLKMLRISNRQLTAWERRKLIEPQTVYSIDDLQTLRKIQQLASSQVPLRTIQTSLQAVRARLSQLRIPFSELGLFAVRKRVEVSCDGQRMDALSGQLTLTFGVADAPKIVEFRGAHQPQLPAADDWFAYAVSLEEAPETREQAAAAYLQCLEVEPNYASAYINLGTLRYNQGNFAEAERCYREALKIDSNYALAHFDLGNVLDETGRITQAIEEYKEAVRLAPNYGDAHYNLALAYEKTGQRRRAVPHWRQYLKVDQSSPWAGHARNQLKRSLQNDELRLVR